MPKLIVGCGYLGSRVADLWRAAGHDVWVTTRSPERARALEQSGYRPVIADVLDADAIECLPPVDSVLWAVGHDRRSSAAIEQVYVDGLKNVLDALPGTLQKLIYISSTGVYGDFSGGWVTEHSPCEPERAGGRACLAAEQLLAAHRLGSKAIVLRMAGIYGPGRLPYLQTIAAGEPLNAPAEGFLNLIHVDDAARVVLAADERAAPPRTYVVADGQPVERGEFYRELARLLAAPPPTFNPLPDAAASHRAAANKRISNARLRAELFGDFEYPSFREGLAAIVREHGV